MTGVGDVSARRVRQQRRERLGVGSADFQSPVAYPITSGTAGYAVAMGSLAASIARVSSS